MDQIIKIDFTKDDVKPTIELKVGQIDTIIEFYCKEQFNDFDIVLFKGTFEDPIQIDMYVRTGTTKTCIIRDNIAKLKVFPFLTNRVAELDCVISINGEKTYPFHITVVEDKNE